MVIFNIHSFSLSPSGVFLTLIPSGRCTLIFYFINHSFSQSPSGEFLTFHSFSQSPSGEFLTFMPSGCCPLIILFLLFIILGRHLIRFLYIYLEYFTDSHFNHILFHSWRALGVLLFSIHISSTTSVVDIDVTDDCWTSIRIFARIWGILQIFKKIMTLHMHFILQN